MFLKLKQPKGETAFINLDNVLRIWPARKGGSGVSFQSHDRESAEAIYQESEAEIEQMLIRAGLLVK